MGLGFDENAAFLPGKLDSLICKPVHNGRRPGFRKHSSPGSYSPAGSPCAGAVHRSASALFVSFDKTIAVGWGSTVYLSWRSSDVSSRVVGKYGE